MGRNFWRKNAVPFFRHFRKTRKKKQSHMTTDTLLFIYLFLIPTYFGSRPRLRGIFSALHLTEMSSLRYQNLLAPVLSS